MKEPISALLKSTTLVLAVLCVSCASNTTILSSGAITVQAPLPTSATDANLFLGNPSNATSNSADKDNFLMEKQFFAESYNDSTGEPNWVSWRLTKADIGSAGREPRFATDNTLPADFTKIRDADYTGTGFDRGHLCPHEDRSATATMSDATFVMSNVIPQAPRLNRDTWAQLEAYCRSLVKSQGQRLYIIDGPLGIGGEGANGPRERIANGRVVVPAYCWKVIVAVPDEGKDDLGEFNQATRVIAVIMPNTNTVGADWQQYRRTVAEIEKQTGYKFFDRLPGPVAQAMEGNAVGVAETGALSQ